MAVAPTPDCLLVFDRVDKTFVGPRRREVRAMEGVSFCLHARAVACILGPSGCGKSTLLRLAAGLESPSAGEVRYRSRPIAGPTRERGMVFQSYSAFPWLTVRENIAFGLTQDREAARRAKIERWLEITGLSEFADAYPKALSGGMRQRLALARALVVDPELLLLDEPFGALDEPVRRSMQSTLLEIVGQLGCSVLFVTHDIGEAIFLADRVLLMSNRPGRILDEFEVSARRPRGVDFYGAPEFNALYEKILTRFPNSLAPAMTSARVCDGDARQPKLTTPSTTHDAVPPVHWGGTLRPAGTGEALLPSPCPGADGRQARSDLLPMNMPALGSFEPSAMSTNFGAAADDYARFRAGFPESVFDRLTSAGECRPGDVLVDVGTGTGTLARGFARRGVSVIAIDPDERLLRQARRLDDTASVRVGYSLGLAEALPLRDGIADVVTAGQCWHWFDGPRAAREFARVAKAGGRVVIVSFDWLPLPGTIVELTERLIKEANPAWNVDAGTGFHPESIPFLAAAGFGGFETFSYDVDVPYTLEGWRGRVRASAGVGASLRAAEVQMFDATLQAALTERFADGVQQLPHRVFAVLATRASRR